VYGQVKESELPIKENQLINPINPYAASKAFQDIISQVYFKSFKLKVIITRMFSYTNARRLNLFQTSFASQIARIEKNEKKILTHGNLKSVRSFIDIKDAMEAYWIAATKGKIGEIYNISGTQIISVKKFLEKLIKLSNKKIKTKVDKKLLRPQDISLQIPNSKKFKKDTGWKPKISLQESVKKLLDECRENI
jgi:nucleoside-diphosphate-sugar epimerase